MRLRGLLRRGTNLSSSSDREPAARAHPIYDSLRTPDPLPDVSPSGPSPAPSGEPPIPTDAELGILRVLWRNGPSTVRRVLEELPAERAVGYTTVLKLLQIMHEKGLVTRDQSTRTHVYRAAVAEQKTERRLVTDLADRAFSGSVGRMVMRALSDRRASAAELDEIRRLIDRLEDSP